MGPSISVQVGYRQARAQAGVFWGIRLFSRPLLYEKGPARKVSDSQRVYRRIGGRAEIWGKCGGGCVGKCVQECVEKCGGECVEKCVGKCGG